LRLRRFLPPRCFLPPRAPRQREHGSGHAGQQRVAPTVMGAMAHGSPVQ
jgi:hypothetical protein